MNGGGEDGPGASLFDGFGEDDFLGGEVACVEAADGFKGVAVDEDEAACRPAEGAAERIPDGEGELGGVFDIACESDACAAAEGVGVEGGGGGGEKGGGDMRIGVDKNEAVAACGAGAGVADGADLTEADGDDAGAEVGGEGGGLIGGVIVDDDDFVRAIEDVGGGAEVDEGIGQKLGFIVGGNDVAG